MISFTKFANDVALRAFPYNTAFQAGVRQAVINVLSSLTFPERPEFDENYNSYASALISAKQQMYDQFKEAFEGAYVKKEPESIHKDSMCKESEHKAKLPGHISLPFQPHSRNGDCHVECTLNAIVDYLKARERPVDTTKTIEELAQYFITTVNFITDIEDAEDLAKILVETFRLR